MAMAAMAMAVAAAQAHFYYANVNFPFRSGLLRYVIFVVPLDRFLPTHSNMPGNASAVLCALRSLSSA